VMSTVGMAIIFPVAAVLRRGAEGEASDTTRDRRTRAHG
jgi:hypothetical protein